MLGEPGFVDPEAAHEGAEEVEDLRFLGEALQRAFLQDPGDEAAAGEMLEDVAEREEQENGFHVYEFIFDC